MKNLKVKVLTMGGNEHEVEIPSDMKIKDLIYELAIALSLPLTDALDSYIKWQLISKELGEALIEEQTLEQCGVQEGYRLLMIRKTLAGVVVEQHSLQDIFTRDRV